MNHESSLFLFHPTHSARRPYVYIHTHIYIYIYIFFFSFRSPTIGLVDQSRTNSVPIRTHENFFSFSFFPPVLSLCLSLSLLSTEQVLMSCNISNQHLYFTDHCFQCEPLATGHTATNHENIRRERKKKRNESDILLSLSLSLSLALRVFVL